MNPDRDACRWEPLTNARWRRLLGAEAEDDAAESPGADPELAGLEEEQLERSGKIAVFFRDPSGIILPADRWYPAALFWSRVKQATHGALRF